MSTKLAFLKKILNSIKTLLNSVCEYIDIDLKSAKKKKETVNSNYGNIVNKINNEWGEEDDDESEDEIDKE